MPRAVDPPGLYPAIDWNPLGKDLLLDPASMPKLDPLTVMEGMFRNILDMLRERIIDLIRDVTGIDLSDVFAVIDQITEAIRFDLRDIPGSVMRLVEGMPIIGELFGDVVRRIVELLTGKLGGTEGDLWNWARGLLNRWTTIPEWLLPPISIGRLTEATPLVADGGFDLIPLEGDSRWYRNLVRGASKPGCPAIDGNGFADELICMPVAVAAGQTYRPSVQVAWDNATGTGQAQLLIIEYVGEQRVNTIVAASVALSGTRGFASLPGAEYTAPAGVTSAAVAVAVTDGFNTGTAYFDDVTGPATRGIMQSWVIGLSDALTGIDNWISGIIDAIWSVFTGIPGIGKTLGEMREAGRATITNIAGLFGITDANLNGHIDLADVWDHLWATILQPLGWIPTVAQDIIDRVINAWENLGELIDRNLSVTGVLDSIFGIFDTASRALFTTTEITTRIRQLESASRSIVLDFAGSRTNLAMPAWQVGTWGGGAGNLGIDGKGNLVWLPSGAGNRTQLAIYQTNQLDTDRARLEWVLSTTPQSYVFDDAYTYICYRVSASDGYNYMLRVRSGYEWIYIQQVVGGQATVLGSVKISPKAGDNYVWEVGYGHDRRYTLWRNGNPIIDVDNHPSDTSRLGEGYRHLAVGMETGNRLVFGQNIPAGLGVLTASEVLV